MVQNIICFSKKEQLTRDVLSSIRKMYGIYKIMKKITLIIMEGAQFDQSTAGQYNNIIINNNTWIGITKQFVSRFGRVHTTSLYSITSTIRANLKN